MNMAQRKKQETAEQAYERDGKERVVRWEGVQVTDERAFAVERVLEVERVRSGLFARTEAVETVVRETYHHLIAQDNTVKVEDESDRGYHYDVRMSWESIASGTGVKATNEVYKAFVWGLTVDAWQEMTWS
jgi:hypothetical protein